MPAGRACTNVSGRQAARSMEADRTHCCCQVLQVIRTGADLYIGNVVAHQNVRGAGAWIHFAPTGKGISFLAGSGTTTGLKFSGFGTYRDHAAPGAGWIPTVHDYGFYCTSANGVYTFEDIAFWNPYRGFLLKGRCTLKDIKMQPLNTGIRTEVYGDTLRLTNIHASPFWSTHDSVKTYSLGNMTNIYLLRTDNPVIDNCFCLWAFAGLRVGQNASGTVSKARVSNCDFDA